MAPESKSMAREGYWLFYSFSAWVSASSTQTLSDPPPGLELAPSKCDVGAEPNPAIVFIQHNLRG